MTDELLDDLAAYMADGEDLPHDPDATIEPPRDADQANAMLRVVQRLGQQRDEIVRLAQAEKAQIDAWAADRTSGLDRRITLIEVALEGWARAVNRETPKRKTLSFPHGTLRLRPGRPSVSVVDEASFVAWALANDRDLLSVKPARAEIKRRLVVGHEHEVEGEPPMVTLAALTGDGEIVPGVVFERPRADGFTLQPAGTTAGGE